MAIMELVLLLILANGAPVLLKKVLGRRFDHPLDGGLRFVDGRPLFGPAKTVRGVVAAVLVTATATWLLGDGWYSGALIGAVAMAGDLFSSFVKRRLGLAPSSRALGLDQVPESLFPALACREQLGLTMVDVGAVVLIFFLGGLALSRLFYQLHIREHPY